MYDQTRQKAIEIYWLNRLSGHLPRISLPELKEVETDERLERVQLLIDIPGKVSSKLKQISNQSDMGLFILFLSGLYIALYKYTGIEDILVGTISFREDGVKEKILFCRNQIDKDKTLKETINRIKENILEDFNYLDYSFGILYQKLLANKDADTLNIFNVAFIYDRLQDRSKLLNQFDLIFILSECNNPQLSLQVEYRSNLYVREIVQQFCNNLIHLFDHLSENLETRIASLEIVGKEEKKILADFNKTAADYPYHKTLHRLFEEQAAKTPDKVALVFENSLITYRHLNEKANQLARYLKKKGVQKGTLLGIMLDRSLEITLVMLAILKAGGAYLPIDPRMPGNRIQTMLKDSRAVMLLTRNDILRNHSFSALQGLSDNGRKPFCTPPREQIKNLDQIPFPNRSLVDLENYNRYIGQVMVKDIISLQTARGCPYNCSYCSKIWHKKHVFRSAEKIFKEMQIYYDMGVRRFSIFDDIFNVNRENSARFFELIIKKGLDVQLFFPNGLRGDLLSRDYIDLLVEAGLVSTALALETASPRLQKLINKNLKLDIFRENVEYFCKKYPQVVLELFTIHGFPTETEEEARMTLDFIKSLEWIHFPYIFILKIYPDTPMADLAMEHGVLREDILRSEDLAFHDLSPTIPFKKSFTKNYQAEFLNEYFLNKERLLHVLPYQVKVFTQDEMIQKYDSYLPTEIKNFEDLLRLADIAEDELKIDGFLPDNHFKVPDLNQKIRKHFPVKKPGKGALRVLILDLSQYFSTEAGMIYDVVEPPLGAMYLMTYLQEKLGDKVDGKILKSRLDFDSYAELKQMLKEFDPQVIGVRSLTFYRDFFHRTISLIRQWGFDVPIIAGGPYATRNSDSLIQDRNIDLLAISEGETAFCEIVEKILENSGKLPDEEVLKEITGIVFIPGSGASEEKFSREIVILDEVSELIFQEESGNLEPVNQASDLAYIIFTSGSTGIPKAVATEHRNLVNVLSWFARRYDLQEDTHVLQLSNYTFDPSVEQIFATLLSGAAVYIPRDREIIADREEFREFVQRNHINIINFVPGTLKELLGYGDKLPGLKKVISGGEKLDQVVKNQIIDKGYELYNHYGPTETTIDALAEKCSQESVTLGKPIANASCYIITSEQILAPIGVPGELCIAGVGVARGYLNRPELTKEKFVENVYASTLSTLTTHYSPFNNCLYRTGDLARWLPEGKVEFLGRIDQQVKIRGFRIEPGEIENRLLTYKAVKEAVVTSKRDDEMGDQYLCAYFVADEEIESTELREHLSAVLPDFMVPAIFVQLDKMPLNANGKVDRSALPNPETSASGADYEPPRNEAEEILVEVWSEVLGLTKENIGIDRNFFEIGGDSIKVIQVAARLRKYSMKIESKELFLNPTIRQLGGHVKRLERKINQSPVQGEVPLMPVQRWFFEENMEEKHHYNQAVLLYSKEGFEEDVVRQIFVRLQVHHDALRMTFKEEQAEIRQINHGLDYPLSLQVFDFRTRAGKDAAEALRAAASEVQASIDLGRGPLMRLGLFHLQDGDRLLIVIHHLVIDGISWRILFEDIDTLYQQYSKGEPFSLPLKTDSFKTWAEALCQYANSEAFLVKEKAYWAQLEATIVPEIKKDFTGTNLRKDTTRLTIDLSEEDTESLLSEVNTAFGTEINDILLTALGLGIQKTFGIDRVLISLEGHGRENILRELEISRTVGWFTSVYPVILDFTPRSPESDEGKLSRHIKEVKENLHRIPNKGIGYGILKYLSAEEHKKDIDFKLKPRIGFNYLGQFDAEVEKMSFAVARESTGRIQSLKGESEFELDISGLVANKKLVISLSYNKKQFEVETSKSLLNNYKTSLLDIISHCVSREEIELTPSDLDYKNLSIEELDSIFD